jgi:hypothetical protein
MGSGPSVGRRGGGKEEGGGPKVRFCCYAGRPKNGVTQAGVLLGDWGGVAIGPKILYFRLGTGGKRRRGDGVGSGWSGVLVWDSGDPVTGKGRADGEVKGTRR